jgi:cell division protein FtsQ
MSAGMRLLTWLLALAVVALPVVAAVNGWIGRDAWPLRTLRVAGQVSPAHDEALRRTVLPFARGGFFAVKLDQAQAAVRNLPWVATAVVRKRWPDVLEVEVEEHRPFARWGQSQLLSVNGRLYPAAGMPVPAGLPQLDGPPLRVPEVLALYNRASELFGRDGLHVVALGVDARGSWSLRLDSGAKVLIGRADADRRLSRFARLLPQLQAERGAVLQRADLRYANGFALTWQAPAKRVPVPASTPPAPPAAAAPSAAPRSLAMRLPLLASGACA